MTGHTSQLRITATVDAAIRRHGRAVYPDECCGALLVRDGTVVEAFPLPNTTAEGPRRRFLVGPGDYRSAEARAAATGCALAGFYHSHPDHPPDPSAYDRAHAWPNFSYVIVSVRARDAGEMKSWRLREDRAGFEPETLVVEHAPELAGPRVEH